MRQLFPADRTIDEPERAYDSLELGPSSDSKGYVYINMVSSLDGRIQLNGRAAGIGSKIDKRLMLGLRSQADCILHGSATVQAEESFAIIPDDLVALRIARGQRAQPLWAFATASGDVKTEGRHFREANPRPIAFVAKSTPPQKRDFLAASTNVVIAGEDRPDPSTMLNILRDQFGCTRVLVEGGPTLNDAMIRTGQVSDLFLTIAPLLLAGNGRTIVNGPAYQRDDLPRTTVVSLFEHKSELFVRYRFESS